MSRPIFRKYGAIEQLQIATVEDMERLETLDEARWSATSVPVEQLFCDPALVSALDTDKNGRIRVDELKEARRWLWARLRNRERVIQGADTLILADLDPSHEEHAQVSALAELLLAQLGAAARDRISLDQVRSFRASYMARFPNGDGVVARDQITDADAGALAEEILASTGGAPDLSGEPGVRAADIDLYLERVKAYDAWRRRETEERETLFPLGEHTEAGAALVSALADKMTQYFAQCALVALEASAAGRLVASADDLAKLDVTSPDAINAWLAVAPLSRPDASGILNLEGALNPRFAAQLRVLADDVGRRALGNEAPLRTLNAAQWAAIQAAFAPSQAWSAARPEGIPDGADPAKLMLWVDHAAVATLRALVEEDAGVADELVKFNTLEKLLLYQRWLFTIVNNSVSFPDLFEPEEQALFQRGVLIMDGRRMQLCVKVTDIAAHKTLANLSLIFLIYLKLERKDGDQTLTETVAAAATSGVRGGIAIGKRGVFYDRDDREWDAIVVDLIAQPISVWEAMIAPFVRVRDQIVSRMTAALESKASAAETSAATSANSAASKAGTAAEAAAKAPAPASSAPGAATAGTTAAGTTAAAKPEGNLQNMLIGGSLAFAALGSSMAFIVNTVAGIALGDLILTILGVVGAVAGVFGLLGWLKLRRRDVSAVLEACGWALNGRMRLVAPLDKVFTQKPGIPAGAEVHLKSSKSALRWALPLALLLAGAAAWVVISHPEWLPAPEAPPAQGSAPAVPEVPAAPAAP